jgi:glycosyltransferase involved in cell wall biosynthesis
MNILYHITNLPPKIPNTEASLQELHTLQNHFGGKLVYLNPNQISPVYLPRLLFGFHQLKQIRAAEHHIQLHQIYNADPFPFPILRLLRKPVIYSVSSGVGQRSPNISFFASLAAITVSDERSLNRLRGWGLSNCYLVRPGIDLTRFSYSPLPLQSEISLMVGSAPWTLRQFQTKGINTLLAAAQQASHLRLIFLWRGVLVEEIERRVRQMGLTKQVEIINQKVEVNQVLAQVHASITLVTNPAIIRSYPHSLMESLAGGKPVIVSRSIPMADYVEQTNSGVVVENITPTDILAAVEVLRQKYDALQKSAQKTGQHDFSSQALIASFQRVYNDVLVKTDSQGQDCS